MPAKTCAADEIKCEVYEPYRLLLVARPTTKTRAEAALARFRCLVDEQRFERWRAGGHKPSTGRPALGPTPAPRYGEGSDAGTAGVVIGNFWTDREVINCRFRWHVTAVRETAKNLARERRLPHALPKRGESVPDFTERLYKSLYPNKDRLKKYGPSQPGQQGKIDWGERMYNRYRVCLYDADLDCRFDWRHGPCGLASTWPRTAHDEFWRLLSSELPIVISARSGRLIDGLRRLEAHRAAGDRSPGVRVEYRQYETDEAERADVIDLNADVPGLSAPARAAIAEHRRDAWREEAAYNSGHSRYEEPRHSRPLRAHGRRGAPLKPRHPVRVNDRLADLAGMSTSTFEKYRPRDGPKPQDPAAAP